MKKIILTSLLILASGFAFASPPSELLVLSCVKGEAASPSITVQELSVHEFQEEDDYAEGFNAPYFFEYKGGDIGYAESKKTDALIYMGKLFRLSRAVPLGNDRGIGPSSFTPFLAKWSIVGERGAQYLCVNFNFDGLGRSGDFQSVHGGYLLNLKTKELYFVVRDIRN